MHLLMILCAVPFVSIALIGLIQVWTETRQGGL